MESLNRILSSIGIYNIVEILSSGKLNWADFHTLLLYIFEKRIKQIQPPDVMQNHKDNRFSQIANIDQRSLMEMDTLLYGLLPMEFESIELSPVNSIGANVALTTLDPKIVLSTIRNLEVVGDPGMTLALECARRRRSVCVSRKDSEIHLATSHRALRLQNFGKSSGLSSHFRAFALTSAARDTHGFNRFQLFSLATHIKIWINFLGLFAGSISNISVSISDIRIAMKLISSGRVGREEVVRRAKDKSFSILKSCSVDIPDYVGTTDDLDTAYPELETHIRELQFTEKEIIASLKNQYPHVCFYFDLARCTGIGYYSGLCYRISAQNKDGQQYSLAGGGACDWTRQLLGSKRERLISSGFGTEVFVTQFRQIQNINEK